MFLTLALLLPPIKLKKNLMMTSAQRKCELKVLAVDVTCVCVKYRIVIKLFIAREQTIT